MSTPRSHKRKPAPDPAQEANRRILAERQARIEEKQAQDALANDLGLDFKEPPSTSTADNPLEFLTEEWDRKAFGDPFPTYTRTVYGPDPLLVSCPQMKADVERLGLENYANATGDALRQFEEKAVPDPIMRKALGSAIHRFGLDSVVDAFRKRILSIPQRQVEIEADRDDIMIFSKPMEDAVIKYGSPGMAPKFLSERCIGVLGMRGYEIVKDKNGDPVKVGTLIMGEIPIRMAERRQLYYAEQSNQLVKEAAETFEDNAAKAVREGGHSGISVLRQGENVSAKATESEDYLGLNRDTGFRVERESSRQQR